MSENDYRAAIRAVMFFAAVTCGLAADVALPKPEVILDNYIEATGGKARYDKLTSQVSSGTFEVPAQGLTGTITVYRAAPNRSRTFIDLGQLGNIEEGVDGKIAWQKSPMTGPHLKDGAEKTFAMRAAVFDNEVAWRDHYDKVELAGVEKVEDRDCYKIVMSGKDANAQTRYYGKKSNLLVKMVLTAVTPMGEIAVDTVMSDYRDEDGIISAHKLVQSGAGQQISITIRKVEYNSALPEGAFDLPPEIKELVAGGSRGR